MKTPENTAITGIVYFDALWSSKHIYYIINKVIYTIIILKVLDVMISDMIMFTLCLPDELVQASKELAEKEHRSLLAQVVYIHDSRHSR
jgi:hypothetical protein